MDLNTALQILNLNKNYTEEELKKAYRKLIIKYHPDKHHEDKKAYAEKKTKELNEAKDILEKNLKNNNSSKTTSTTHTEYNPYYQNQTTNKEYLEILKKFKNELQTELETIKKIKYYNSHDLLFQKNELNFISILNEFSYKILITKNSYSIKKDYQNFRKQYINALERYYLDFYKATGIDTDIYIAQYCDTINEIRNLMYKSIANILKLELSKFINEEYFDEILPLLYSIKKKYILTCLYGYAKIEDTKNTFNNIIVTELKKYKKRKQLLNELETNQAFVITNLKQIIDLRENILSEEKFYNIYSQIDILTKFKCKTKNLFKKKKSNNGTKSIK